MDENVVSSGPVIVRLLSARKAVLDARRLSDDASAEFEAAIVAAVDAGVSQAEIGRLLGMKRQSVRQYVERGRR